MHTIRRPYGRFFVVLIVWLACVAPRAVAADGAGSPPAAPSAGGIHQLSVVSGRLSVKPALGTVLLKPLHAYFDNGLQLTQITDTVYYANGSKAKGTLLISWPSFTTASQNVVAAGSLGVTLGADGLFSASLAPTTGSTPTGVYYTVVYQLGEGGSFFQEWSGLFVVPSETGGRICVYYPRLQPGQSNGELRREWEAPFFNTLSHVSLRALPTTDSNDGEIVLCYRSYFPTEHSAVY
jgi:hypothetical protein